MDDFVQLETEGQAITGWKDITVNMSMEQLSASFTITLVDKEGTATDLIRGGLAVQLYIVNKILGFKDLVLDGHIDRVSKKVSGGATSMTVSGRDRNSDLVDCSAIHKSSTWNKAKLGNICAELAAPYFIEVDVSEVQNQTVIEKFTLQQGETSFEAIERLCRSQAILPMRTEDGQIKLTYTAPPSVRGVEDLELGKNIEELTEDDNRDQRFKQYLAKGQSSGKGKKWSKANTQIKALAEDEGIDRYRPLLFMSENKATPKNMQARVNWEAQTRAGKGLQHTVLLLGWYQKARGIKFRPWRVNERVNLKIDRWGFNEERLITGVTLRLTADRGRTTTLVLKHPDTYAANPTEKVKLS
jgi:prophage tail gpP-like protein